MDTIFLSKIDNTFKYLFYLVMAVSVITGLYLIYEGFTMPDLAHSIHRWIFSVKCFAVGVYLPWSMLKDTRYYVDGDCLIAKIGHFKQRILVKHVQSIVKGRNLIGGPALSQDRLMIYYQNGEKRQQLVISPENPDDFIVWLAEHPSATFLDDADYT